MILILDLAEIIHFLGFAECSLFRYSSGISEIFQHLPVTMNNFKRMTLSKYFKIYLCSEVGKREKATPAFS